MLRTHVVRALSFLLFVLVVLFLVGALIGQPILLSFVTSGSMSPTIDEGDGFVAIPELVAGEIQEGDVVVFEAQEIQGGGLTTHRVVDVTADGYITRGDANPFTDQDGGEPPVTDDQVLAVAWQPGGHVVTIPVLGTLILGGRVVITNILAAVTTVLGIENVDESQQAGSVLLASGLLLFVVSLLSGLGTRSTRERSHSGAIDAFDPRFAALFFLAIVLIPANAAMIFPNTTHHIPIGDDVNGNQAIAGEQATIEMTVTNEDAMVTMLVVFDATAEDALQDPWLDIPGGERDSTTLSVAAPPPGEERIVSVAERRYVVVLPPSLLVALHNVHPLLALWAINATLIFGVLTVVFGLLGVRKRRNRRTDRDVPLWVRLKRLW